MFNQTAHLQQRIASGSPLWFWASKAVEQDVPHFEPDINTLSAEQTCGKHGLSTYDLPPSEGFCTHFSLCLRVDAQRQLRRRDWLDHVFERLTYRHRYQESTYDLDGPSNMAMGRLMNAIPPALPFLRWADRVFVLLRLRGVAALPSHQIVAAIAVAENPFCYERVHCAAARLAMCEIAHTVCLPVSIPPTVRPDRMFAYVHSTAGVRITITRFGARTPGVRITEVIYRFRAAEDALACAKWIQDFPRFDRPFLYMQRRTYKYDDGRHHIFSGIDGMKAILVKMGPVRASQLSVRMELLEQRDSVISLLVSAPLHVCANEAARHGLSQYWYVLPTCDMSLMQWSDEQFVCDVNDTPRLLNASAKDTRLILRFRDVHDAPVCLQPSIRIYVLAFNILRRWCESENVLFRF